MTDSHEPAWPQFSQGRPVPGTGWKQPPGQPGAAVPRPDDPTVVDASLIPAPDPTPVAAEPAASKLCLQCGGEVDTDGYCTQCGAKAPTEREHFEESPAAWVGAVCDRGVKHARNEDALATDADEAMGSRAVLVVCDGVTTSTDSDVAALAAARAARDVLVEGRPEDMGTPASRSAAVSGLFARAAAVANDAVAHHTAAGEKNPAACTFVAALVLDNVVYAGNVGDSRAYWLPDSGDGAILTRDDSMAEDSIASGVPRKQAETAADAHTITRWLGVDAADVVPQVASMHVPGPGWVLVCSDGLWNYASEPSEIGKVVSDAVGTANSWREKSRQAIAQPPATESTVPAPVEIARAMVNWAIAQGGHDNISACLARVGDKPVLAAPVVVDGEIATSKIMPSGASQTDQPSASANGVREPVAATTAYDPITHEPIPATTPLEG
ncbi:MAG TPA: protein phosphatase 2C domain-containing protein [Propioniciclava tarda]|nr:protein phosphatase 2C domain-containing protein [Propioniciclava tarda]HQA31392.1 protein phosphatase 2C domain-containing protein [Propioniciclava tarda]HQD61168.1 protein phosphatase 2C domain-containing protein [Propioniciclava tarda]